MYRRTVLELFAGVAVAGLPTGQPAPKRVVIAGAGMLGANIAYQLVTRGAQVTVVERHQPGQGATARSFGFASLTKPPTHLRAATVKWLDRLAPNSTKRCGRGFAKPTIFTHTSFRAP